MTQTKKIVVDRSKVKMAIETGIPLSITTYTLPHAMEVYMGDVLTVFLTELDQKQMIEYLNYCLNELVANAKKANTKRVYFDARHLDITNEADYELGMKTFKDDTLNNIRYYLDLQKKAGLYVKLILQMRKNKIKLEVRNNSELTVFEYKRIHDKVSRVQQYTSVNEAISQILDNSEGAGLGLIIMILMLEKIGLTEENFQVLSQKGETITRIILPLNEKTQTSLSLLSSEFVRLIDDLPQFPENIATVNRLLNDPDSKMSDIAMHISNDVSLTAELLRMVNSAAFAMTTPCRSISDAVRMVGIRGLKNLLYSIGSLTNLSAGEDRAKKDIWTHAYAVAFYSYNMARNFCATDKRIIEDAYVCGLLHDMGKIIFQTAHPGLISNLEKLCTERSIPRGVFELLLAGVNHGEIGALIAEKWNFPDVIVNVIRYHHEPDIAPEEYHKLTSLVYLADMTVHYINKEIDFDQVDTDVLTMFRITDKDQFDKIAKRLDNAFERQ
jgi:putative nucleotidyltransferase with HDIG domain